MNSNFLVFRFSSLFIYLLSRIKNRFNHLLVILLDLNGENFNFLLFLYIFLLNKFFLFFFLALFIFCFYCFVVVLCLKRFLRRMSLFDLEFFRLFIWNKTHAKMRGVVKGFLRSSSSRARIQMRLIVVKKKLNVDDEMKEIII